MTDRAEGEVTRLLAAAGDGDAEAAERIATLVYEELRDLAQRILAHERPGQTLRTTALVNEAYLRLAGRENVPFEDRAHFLGTAARAMRSILVDYARARGARKRGGAWGRVPLDDVLDAVELDRLDVLALDEALTRLDEIAPRKSRVVELRFFGGLSIAQAAQVLDVSHGTVENDWQFARTWLHRELDAGGSER